MYLALDYAAARVHLASNDSRSVSSLEGTGCTGFEKTQFGGRRGLYRLLKNSIRREAGALQAAEELYPEGGGGFNPA